MQLLPDVESVRAALATQNMTKFAEASGVEYVNLWRFINRETENTTYVNVAKMVNCLARQQAAMLGQELPPYVADAVTIRPTKAERDAAMVAEQQEESEGEK